jgi:hypothetical protein
VSANPAAALRSVRPSSHRRHSRTWDASWNGWLPGSGHEVARLKALDVKLLDDRVIGEGPLKLFRFADPDGNVLELFSL